MSLFEGIPDGYSVMDDMIHPSVVILNPQGKEIGRLDQYAAVTGSRASYEARIREIIQLDMNQPVDTHRGYAIEKLERVQKYLENIKDSMSLGALEKEWFIGVGSNCVGCLGMDKPNIDHLRSKFHACLRLEVNRNELGPLIEASFDYYSEALKDAALISGVGDNGPRVIDTPQAVEGWRGFKLSISDGWRKIRLKGGNNHIWETNSLSGDCYGSRDALIEHIEAGTHYPTGTYVPIGQVWSASSAASNSYLVPKLNDVTVYTGRTSNLKHPTRSAYGDGSCRCGIYGFETLEKLYTDASAEFAVYTRVVAWGTVLVDVSNNFRASDITFTEIWINRNEARGPKHLNLGSLPDEWFNWDRLCHYLADFYQVPVVMAKNYDEILKLREYEERGMDFMLELNRFWPKPLVDPDMGKDDLGDMRYL